MKKLSAALLFGTLALTACGGDKTPAVSSLTSVSGTVVERDTTKGDELNLVTMPWTGGAGKVVMIGKTANQLASGDLNANGSFSLSLPASVVADQLDSYNPNYNANDCTGKLNVSEPDVRGANVYLGVVANKTGNIQPTLMQGNYNATTHDGSVTMLVGGLVYVDRAVTMSGSVSCKDGNTPNVINVDMKLSKGWNFMTMTSKYTMVKGVDGTNSTIESGKLPTNNWLFTAVGSQSLKSPTLKIPNFF